MPREKLYERINLRVDEMFERGLANETRRLIEMGYDESVRPMNAIGYKEAARFVRGLCSESEARDQIKKATRALAKRQITWLKNRSEGKWIDVDVFNINDIINSENSSGWI